MTYMRPDEIKAAYRQMHPNQKRLKILAQLNDCSVTDITELIMGVPAKIGIGVNAPKVFTLNERGWTDREIAQELGISINAVCQHRYRQGLKANKRRVI